MLSLNLEQFLGDIDRIAEKTKGRLRLFAVEFIQDLNQEVVEATPWITGFLRGSWYARLNSPPDASGQPDPTGMAAVGRMNVEAVRLRLGDWYYAVNGANYAVFVEYGTSRMAPRAFVRKTIARAPAIADAAARRVAALP